MLAFIQNDFAFFCILALAIILSIVCLYWLWRLIRGF
jgi:hypothetical protein